jgi:hypothetical protein
MNLSMSVSCRVTVTLLWLTRTLLLSLSGHGWDRAFRDQGRASERAAIAVMPRSQADELHDTMRRKNTGACRSPAYYSPARLRSPKLQLAELDACRPGRELHVASFAGA